MILPWLRSFAIILLIFWVPPAVLARQGTQGSGMVAAHGGPAAAPEVPVRPASSDPAALAIVEDGLTAAGGRARLAAVATMSRRGIVLYDGLPGFFGEWFRAPATRRVELHHPRGSFITIADGLAVSRREGVSWVKLQKNEAAEWLRRASPWPALRAAELSIVYEVIAGVDVDSRPTRGVRTHYGDGSVCDEYYDTMTGLLVRRDERDSRGAVQSVSVFSDYQETGGILLAKRVVRSAQRRKSEYQFKEIEVDRAGGYPFIKDEASRATEELVAVTTPFILRFEPFDPEVKYEQIAFRLILANARPGPDSSLTIRMLSNGAEVESRALSGLSLASNASIRDGTTTIALHFLFARGIDVDTAELIYQEGGRTGRVATLRRGVERRTLRAEFCLPLRVPTFVAMGHGPGDHHSSERSQAYAYDLVPCDMGGNIMVEGGRGRSLSEYAGFGAEVIAPADAIVVSVRDEFEDHDPPGSTGDPSVYQNDAEAIVGNYIVLDHGNYEYSLLGHLRAKSIVVAPGDRVPKGATIARVGNTGFSNAPHLHFQVMDGPRLFECDGIPIRFHTLLEDRTDRRSPFLRAGAIIKPVGTTASKPASGPVTATSRGTASKSESSPSPSQTR